MSRVPFSNISPNIPAPMPRRPLMKAGPSCTLSLTSVNVNAVPFPAVEQLVNFPSENEHGPNCLDLLRPTTRQRVQSQSAGSSCDSIDSSRTLRRTSTVIGTSSPSCKSPRRRRSSSSLSLSNKVKSTAGRKHSKLANDVHLAGLVHRSIAAEMERRRKSRLERAVSSDVESDNDVDMDVDDDASPPSSDLEVVQIHFDLMVQDTMLAARLRRFLNAHGKGRPTPPPHHLCQAPPRPNSCPPAVEDTQEPPMPFDALVASLTLRYRDKALSKGRRKIDRRDRRMSPLSARLV